jgi:hypothetical protein
MRKLLCLPLTFLLFVLCTECAAARDTANPGRRPTIAWSSERALENIDPGLRGLYESAAVDTYCIVWYSFETNSWQGWTRVNNTAQIDTFFHVDDFVGLGGGSFGGLVPAEGTKSMWCGVRPNASDPYLCSWKRAPGYGNNWSQMLVTDAISLVGAMIFSYHLAYDSEPDYDFTYVEYDGGGGNWQRLAVYDNFGDTIAQHYIPLTISRTKLRFRFTSDGAWSDQDGLWDTDGAAIVDALRVRDHAAYNNYQDFESVPVNAVNAGIWHAQPEIAFGNYSGLKNNLTDKDPCGDNLGTQVVFFVGSPNPSSSYPGLYDTPFCMGPGGVSAPCQSESIVSPVLDMMMYTTNNSSVQNGTIPPGDLPLLGGCYLVFTVYRDLPLANLMFYVWSVRSIDALGCPGQWQDDNYVYLSPRRDYLEQWQDVGKYIAGDDPVQIALGVQDMCDVWYLSYGNCGAHTPSPWIDNVRLYRFKTVGPQWGFRDLDFFQDNFPGAEYDLESIIRADMANDIFPNTNPVIRPGDSIVVDCNSILGGGIAADPTFGGPAVYLHVKATYIGPAPTKPNLFGPTLAGSVTYGTTTPVTVYFNYVSDDGVWTKIQAEEARTGAGVVDDKYMVDLNDNLFTRGYAIEYYFTARDNAGIETALPTWARSNGPCFEFTCLPTLNSDVLFVDDWAWRGTFTGTVTDYWKQAFEAVLAPPNDKVDIYHVNGPASAVSSGPGGRAKNYHLTTTYRTIVWDSGTIPAGVATISDGITDKSNDAQMLVDWMSLSENRCGLWVCGDDVAADLNGSSAAAAIALMTTWCGVDLVETSFSNLTGIVNPLLTGDGDAGIFVHGGVPDQFYAYGGCPMINDFDVLERAGGGRWALRYPDVGGTSYYAAIANEQDNSHGQPVRTMWFGFSYMYVRDDVQSTPQDRFEIARDVFAWMQSATNANVSDAKIPLAFALAQNFPNPFNPSTTIRFDMKEKGLVTIKIYDVGGRLVRTLVDGVMNAGSHGAAWDGRNGRGAAVASGIYFYKMETKDFSQTRKMVVLR